MGVSDGYQSWGARILRRIWQAIKIYFFILGVSVFALFVSFLFILYDKGVDFSFLSDEEDVASEKEKLPKRDVAVVVQLSGLIRDDHLHGNVQPSHLGGLFSREGRSYSLGDLSALLRRLKNHDRVQAVLLQLEDDLSISFQQVRSLHDDLKSLKESKPLYFFSSLYGDNTYLLSAMGSSTVLMPGGHVLIEGASFMTMHIGGLMKKFGVGVDIFRVGKYKSAASMFEERAPAAEKEMLYSALDVLVQHKVDYLTEVKEGLSAEDAGRWFRKQIFYDEEALESGLISDISEVEEFKQITVAHVPTLWVNYDEFSWGLPEGEIAEEDEEKWGESQESVGYFSSWRKGSSHSKAEDESIGLLEYHGEIAFSSGDSESIVVSRVAKDVDWMIKQDHIKAVVMYLNTPGGGALAAEMIWSHLRRLAERKPLVAYVGKMAASGGYYMAVAADRIVADPSSITGSIGVVGVRFNINEVARKYGITTQVYSRGDMPEIMDFTQLLSMQAKQYFQRSARRFYEVFLDRVAVGRRMDAQVLHETGAQGRIWVGSQALHIGLVDSLGSLKTAFLEAADLARSAGANIGDSFPVVRPKGKSSQLLECLGDPVGCLFASEKGGAHFSPLLTRLLDPMSAQERFGWKQIRRLRTLEPLQARLWIDLDDGDE